MMVKKSRNQETSTLIIDEDELSANSEDDQTFTDLSSKLAEIRKDEGIIGYIIRNATSATIDLKEPEKLVEYAIFSSQMLDSSREISDLFELGNVETIFVEGKENNALSMTIDGNKISIFMEKDEDYTDVLKKISP